MVTPLPGLLTVSAFLKSRRLTSDLPWKTHKWQELASTLGTWPGPLLPGWSSLFLWLNTFLAAVLRLAASVRDLTFHSATAEYKPATDGWRAAANEPKSKLPSVAARAASERERLVL